MGMRKRHSGVSTAPDFRQKRSVCLMLPEFRRLAHRLKQFGPQHQCGQMYHPQIGSKITPLTVDITSITL